MLIQINDELIILTLYKLLENQNKLFHLQSKYLYRYQISPNMNWLNYYRQKVASYFF